MRRDRLGRGNAAVNTPARSDIREISRTRPGNRRTSADFVGVADANSAQIATANPHEGTGFQLFFSIPDLAGRWRCSRASVYNRLRGEKVVDFATNGRKGHKVVPLATVLKIEREHLRVLR